MISMFTHLPNTCSQTSSATAASCRHHFTLSRSKPLKTTLAVCILLAYQFCSGETPNEPCNQEGAQRPIYGAECRFISAHENPADLTSRKINIFVTRVKSIQQTEKPPIFFISGGPGQASSDLLPLTRYYFSSLLVDHDFVFVDQRGTGKSAPLNCDVDILKYADTPLKQVEELAFQGHKACVAEFDADLSRYTTPYAVKDLEIIREALGYNKVLLWGVSYGTRVILEYLRSAPNSIEGVVLDGVAPVAIQLPNFIEQDGSAALGAVFELCRNNAPCQRAFPDLEKHWLALLTNLSQQPRTVELKHPRTQHIHAVLIDDQILSSWVRAILYSREVSPILPLAIHRATQNDFSLLFSIFGLNLDQINESISEGMHSAVLCAEDRHYTTLNPIEKNAEFKPSYKRLLHLDSSSLFERTCNLYPASTLSAEYFAPATSSVPTLLLSGRLDPVTPPKWAEQVKQQLSNTRHLEVEGGHHMVSRLGCMPKLITQFFKNPSNLKTLDAECTQSIQPTNFFIDSAGPALRAPIKPEKKKESTP